MKLTNMILRKAAVTGLCVMGLSAFAISAKANLVTNGSFETNGGGGQIGSTTTLANWSVPAPNGSYAYVFGSASQAGTGVTGQYGTLSLFPITNSPDGGSFVGTDPAFQNGAISQTINGLTIGAQYLLTFDWAAAQQQGYSGGTNDWWTASLGGSSQSTAQVSIPSHGFSGWQNGSMTFTATGTSELLSFLAGSTSTSGEPPFALLDGVSLTQVTSTPEPASWTMLVGGLGLLGVARFTRAKNWFKG
jgi:hypothetical protein